MREELKELFDRLQVKSEAQFIRVVEGMFHVTMNATKLSTLLDRIDVTIHCRSLIDTERINSIFAAMGVSVFDLLKINQEIMDENRRESLEEVKAKLREADQPTDEQKEG